MWGNECSMEHTSTKNIAEEVIVEVKVDVEFGMGNISIGNETVDDWKTAQNGFWMKLQQGLQQNKMENEYAKWNAQKPHKRRLRMAEMQYRSS